MSVPRKVLRAIYVTTAVALLAIALARPQAGGRAKLEKQRGLDVVVALDFSKSMMARDVSGPIPKSSAVITNIELLLRRIIRARLHTSIECKRGGYRA